MTPDTLPVVVYLGPPEGEEALRLASQGRVRVRAVPPEVGAVAEALREADAVLDASMKVRLTKELLDAAPGLSVVACATTGSDHVDADALAARGIPLVTLKGETGLLGGLTPAAEHSWLLLMACARRLCAARAHVVAGGWDRVAFPGVMLKGKTLGIIGCGRIGSWMTRYARAFQMRVIGYDPYVGEMPEGAERAGGLGELLGEADFVSVHVHLSDETRGLLGRAELARMKPGAILVNTSRGELLDEEALLDGLLDGRIAAAGLDVLTGEPDIAKHPLRVYAEAHDNLILTPHIGGYSPDAVRVVVDFCARRILEHLGAAS